MLASIRNLIFLCVGLLSACSVKLPEGKFKCSTDKDCPSDWVCADSLCYSERPMGVGDGGQGNGADGAVDDAGGDDFDAGINTTDCDAFTTFYRDSDDDGLGNAAQSVAACSVMNGYVTNQDDCNDMCTACTKPDVEEICDGYDNECDGRVDDGQLKFSTRVSFEAFPNSPWVESVPVAGGAIMFSAVKSVSGPFAIYAQRFDSEGAAVDEAKLLEGSVPEGVFNIAADVLEGKIIVAWLESDGVKATVLKASDLSVLVNKTKVANAPSVSPALDVALSTSASGGRALFAYETGGGIEVQGRRLTDLTIDTSATTIYTPSDVGSARPVVSLAAAPCLSGFYAAVQDGFLKVLRVVPLGDDGNLSGTSYDVVADANAYFTALPALRVEGGSCDAAPTRVVLGYASSTNLVGSQTSKVRVSFLAISRAAGLDTFEEQALAGFEKEGAVLPAYYALPSGYVFNARSLDLLPYDGRYLLSVASGASLDGDVAALDVAEIEGNDVIAKYEATEIAPVGPKSIQLLNLDGKAWLGTSFWSNQDPGGLLRIGCSAAR